MAFTVSSVMSSEKKMLHYYNNIIYLQLSVDTILSILSVACVNA